MSGTAVEVCSGMLDVLHGEWLKVRRLLDDCSAIDERKGDVDAGFVFPS